MDGTMAVLDRAWPAVLKRHRRAAPGLDGGARCPPSTHSRAGSRWVRQGCEMTPDSVHEVSARPAAGSSATRDRPRMSARTAVASPAPASGRTCSACSTGWLWRRATLTSSERTRGRQASVGQGAGGEAQVHDHGSPRQFVSGSPPLWPQRGSARRRQRRPLPATRTKGRRVTVEDQAPANAASAAPLPGAPPLGPSTSTGRFRTTTSSTSPRASAPRASVVPETLQAPTWSACCSSPGSTRSSTSSSSTTSTCSATPGRLDRRPVRRLDAARLPGRLPRAHRASRKPSPAPHRVALPPWCCAACGSGRSRRAGRPLRRFNQWMNGDVEQLPISRSSSCWQPCAGSDDDLPTAWVLSEDDLARITAPTLLLMGADTKLDDPAAVTDSGTCSAAAGCRHRGHPLHRATACSSASLSAPRPRVLDFLDRRDDGARAAR